MNEEEKSLLLKDLCSRLPYGVKVYIKPSLETGEEGVETTLELIDVGYNVFNAYSVYPESVIPYLRPMSSMTENEKLEYLTVTRLRYDDNKKPYRELTIEAIDWLNRHHFDYRRLIEKGLALEAPQGMYDKK